MLSDVPLISTDYNAEWVRKLVLWPREDMIKLKYRRVYTMKLCILYFIYKTYDQYIELLWEERGRFAPAAENLI
jgi:hypothetical protein